LEHAIMRALEQAGMAASDIGLVLTAGIGVRNADDCELSVLSRVLAKERARPALGSFSRAFGQLMEAGGVMELALAAAVAATGEVPAAARVRDDAVAIDRAKPGILVLRASTSGDYAVVALRRES
jgi:3-oxoacyl-(acyl-carrier-protein) synthase